MSVAALIVPLFGDQSRNAAMLTRARIALTFSKFDLHDSEALAAAVRAIRTDE